METSIRLRKIFFKDENTGWVTAAKHWYFFSPTLFKTDDGGESWLKIDYPYQINDMIFKDSLNGWAVGLDSLCRGVILETNNGGEDWTVQMDSLCAPLNGIDYKDGIVWAVGWNGLILKKYDSTNVSTIEDPEQIVDRNMLLKIYPNPTNSTVNIETGIQGQYSMELLNLNGQLLMKTVLTVRSHQLDLSSYQKGIYFIAIRSKDFVSTRKIIKL